MSDSSDTQKPEAKELYSDKNLSSTVRDIYNKTNAEFEIPSDEYDENLKSRYLLLCRRIRDSHTTAKVDDMARIQLFGKFYDIVDGWYHEATRHHLVDVAPPKEMLESLVDEALNFERGKI